MNVSGFDTPIDFAFMIDLNVGFNLPTYRPKSTILYGGGGGGRERERVRERERERKSVKGEVRIKDTMSLPPLSLS